MVKSHEIRLEKTAFSNFTQSDYIIVKNQDYSVSDFILFIEYEIINLEEEESPSSIERDTGLYRMTQIKDVVANEGLKEGYVMLVLTKL